MGFESSDNIRTARPLKYVKTVELGAPLALERGGALPQVRIAYETWGTLNRDKGNAVLVCHALSGDSHAARHDADDDAGWWDIMVGPGKPIDTDRFFVICPNVLGGCRGSTGPNSINPATGRPWGAQFPLITVGDMIQAQRLLVDQLGIDVLHAVVGGSLGGHLALGWAAWLGERVKNLVAIATSPRLNSQSLAFDVVGRNAILADAHFNGGQYYDRPAKPQVGLAIARMLGHITYLSREAMASKFDPDRLTPRQIETQFETAFSVGSYLAYQGNKFVERFDANSYLVLTMAMDLFDLGATRQRIAESFAGAQCRWLLLSFSTDWLFPPNESQQIVDSLLWAGKPVSYCQIQSHCGHDAFLLPDDFALYGEMTRAFLAPAKRRGTVRRAPAARPAGRSIYTHRVDYDSILRLIPQGSSVLDLGCGQGELLSRLRDREGASAKLMGIELSASSILSCLSLGLDVTQADINQGLSAYPDGSFDFVVLSLTLQSVTEVVKVIDEMLRVGRRGLVSFPNFAYRPLRDQLFNEGRAPRAGSVLGHTWYESPNIRFLAIRDLEEFCLERGIQILDRVALDTSSGCEVTDDPNLNADVAVMVIGR